MQKLAANAPVTEKYVNSRAYLHVLGTNPDDDAPLLGAGLAPAIAIDPAEIPIVASPIGSKYAIGLVINGVQNEFKLYVARLSALAGDKTPSPDELNALHHSAHEECFIATSLKSEITVESR